MSETQHHIHCGPGDVAPYVLLPGNVDRAHRIAEQFDEATLVAEHREYVTYTGRAGDAPISVTSTGIGCPSTAIAVEELVQVGADTLIRVGTSGGMQKYVDFGDQVIAQAAIRDEGTTDHYMYEGYPAVADLEVTNALVAAVRERGHRHHVGIVQSKDSFYGQHEAERMPVADRLQARWSAWIHGGALASEMECAAIFVVSAILGARGGGICLAAGNQLLPPISEEERAEKVDIDDTIGTAIRAVQILHQAAADPPDRDQ